MDKFLNKPVIKWSGSKRKVAFEIHSYFPKEYSYYHEPFVGGGSMLPYSKGRKGFASDIIYELISLWDGIKNDPQKIYAIYKSYWEDLQSRGPEVYYEVRDHFNKTRDHNAFLFLTRTCVNGLIRFNKNNDFNNSFHLSRPGIHPARLEKILLSWSKAISNIDFSCNDYRESLNRVQRGDLVFLDPPYGGTVGRYQNIEFDVEDFYTQIERLNSIGAYWILTFDGNAGVRNYDYRLPKEIYTEHTFIKTGNSPFTKTMKKSIDQINESLYANFKISKNTIQGSLF